MAEVIIIVALVLALVGQGWYLLSRTDRHETEIAARHAQALARSDARVNDLLDRIQAPSVGEYHAMTREPNPAPVGDFRYDETGLVQVDFGDEAESE